MLKTKKIALVFVVAKTCQEGYLSSYRRVDVILPVQNVSMIWSSCMWKKGV